MELRKFKAKARGLVRGVSNIVRGGFLRREYLWPHIAVWYPNYDCNAACSFCSRKTEIAGGLGHRNSVDWQRISTILNLIYKITPSLYINGGEPLLEERIEDILRRAKRIGFWPIVINTNAILLDRYPDVLRLADKVVVSMHAVRPDRIAELFSITEPNAQRSLQNIRRAAAMSKGCGSELVANCVLTEANVGQDAFEVLQFCEHLGIKLTVVPAIADNWPMLEKSNAKFRDKYTEFLDAVIRLKKRDSGAVEGTLGFFERIRDFGTFQCRPTAILTVDPEGSVVNPCGYKYHQCDRLLAGVDPWRQVEEIMTTAFNYEDPFAPCEKRCLKLCRVGPALVLEDPVAAAKEYGQ